MHIPNQIDLSVAIIEHIASQQGIARAKFEPMIVDLSFELDQSVPAFVGMHCQERRRWGQISYDPRGDRRRQQICCHTHLEHEGKHHLLMMFGLHDATQPAPEFEFAGRSQFVHHRVKEDYAEEAALIIARVLTHPDFVTLGPHEILSPTKLTLKLEKIQHTRKPRPSDPDQDEDEDGAEPA